mmetsp:Transcript_16271/g.53155  ORF Transcript_16271/g.53155 Transcript_16271/m.53155 type:complete len:346 (-) Transcript_16271:1130-2167(-)
MHRMRALRLRAPEEVEHGHGVSVLRRGCDGRGAVGTERVVPQREELDPGVGAEAACERLARAAPDAAIAEVDGGEGAVARERSPERHGALVPHKVPRHVKLAERRVVLERRKDELAVRAAEAVPRAVESRERVQVDERLHRLARSPRTRVLPNIEHADVLRLVCADDERGERCIREAVVPQAQALELGSLLRVSEQLDERLHPRTSHAVAAKVELGEHRRVLAREGCDEGAARGRRDAARAQAEMLERQLHSALKSRRQSFHARAPDAAVLQLQTEACELPQNGGRFDNVELRAHVLIHLEGSSARCSLRQSRHLILGILQSRRRCVVSLTELPKPFAQGVIELV